MTKVRNLAAASLTRCADSGLAGAPGAARLPGRRQVVQGPGPLCQESPPVPGAPRRCQLPPAPHRPVKLPEPSQEVTTDERTGEQGKETERAQVWPRRRALALPPAHRGPAARPPRKPRRRRRPSPHPTPPAPRGTPRQAARLGAPLLARTGACAEPARPHLRR